MIVVAQQKEEENYYGEIDKAVNWVEKNQLVDFHLEYIAELY